MRCPVIPGGLRLPGSAGHMPVSLASGLAFLKMHFATTSPGCEPHAVTINTSPTAVPGGSDLVNVARCPVLFCRSPSCLQGQALKMKGPPHQTHPLTPFPAGKRPCEMWVMFSCQKMQPPSKRRRSPPTSCSLMTQRGGLLSGPRGL